MRKTVNEKDVRFKTKLLRWIAGQICKAGVAPAWVTNHTNPIMKSHLSFRANFWWSIIYWRIRPIFMDNVVTLERVALLASIMAGYAINWAPIIVKQIHESVFRTQTEIPFPILIHRLCNAVEIHVSLLFSTYMKKPHAPWIPS